MDDIDDDMQELKERDKIEHVGFKPHLTIFPSGDLECAFAYGWIERMGIYGPHGEFLNLMMHGTEGNDEFDQITQRDARVAATVIQWLGTNVGFAFLNGVFREHGQYKIVDIEAEKRIAEIMRKSVS